LEIMRGMDASSVDAIVTDPPYELSFMNKGWDSSGIAFNIEVWREALRVLKPGGYLLAFGGTRTYHRMTVAIEDAGFEIRDCIGWHYGSGFPKSLDVSKAIDKAAGIWRGRAGAVASQNGSMSAPNYERTAKGPPVTDAAKAWVGWGTALKPAWEPVVVARKPLEGTVAANVLKHGTGAMNIDASRVPHGNDVNMDAVQRQQHSEGSIVGAFGAASLIEKEIATYKEGGRWPANILLTHAVDCSDEGCVAGCPCAAMDAQSGTSRSVKGAPRASRAPGLGYGMTHTGAEYNDEGGASRFFNQLAIKADDLVPFIYAAKASRREREAGCPELPERSGEVRNHHPTVKPISVMEWCIRLVTREGALVLDPFCGSGTTGAAAVRLGRRFIGCEQSAEYVEIARARITHHGHQLKLG
jgi:site-specific DNA-methyltransferase (adenine-specific)